MVNSVIGMCDENTVYMKKLAEYFMQKSNIPLQIRSFSDWEQLILYLESEKLDVLILGGPVFLDKWENQDDVQVGVDKGLYEEGVKKHVKWVIKLVDLVVEKESIDNRILKISRYQPPAELLETAQELATGAVWNGSSRITARIVREDSFYDVKVKRNIGVESQRMNECNTHVIGIYSPVNRCGKTSLAILFAELLRRRGNSLMICMDHHCNIFMDEEQNIAELVYHLSREQQLCAQSEGMRNFSDYDEFVKKWDGISYIAASQSVENMMQISAKQFEELLDMLRKRSLYQYVVLDLSEGIENFYKVLEQCDVVFMPVLKDCIAQYKVEQFEQQMGIVMGQEKWSILKRRIYKIQLPQTIETDTMENYYRELIWSDFGNYAGQLLEQYGI